MLYLADHCDCADKEMRHGEWEVVDFQNENDAEGAYRLLAQTRLYFAVHLNGRHVVHVPPLD